MSAAGTRKVADGVKCTVVGGTHAGKSGVVRDVKTGKTGHVSITVVQSNGERFKTLAKNVKVQPKPMTPPNIAASATFRLRTWRGPCNRSR